MSIPQCFILEFLFYSIYDGVSDFDTAFLGIPIEWKIASWECCVALSYFPSHFNIPHYRWRTCTAWRLEAMFTLSIHVRVHRRYSRFCFGSAVCLLDTFCVLCCVYLWKDTFYIYQHVFTLCINVYMKAMMDWHVLTPWCALHIKRSTTIKKSWIQKSLLHAKGAW